jgi:hypothetical protein
MKIDLVHYGTIDPIRDASPIHSPQQVATSVCALRGDLIIIGSIH